MIRTALTLAAAVAAAASVQALFARRDRRLLPPIGRIVDGLHVRMLGDRGPTVVFEAGLAATSLNWSGVQPRVAARARTISYDRAGLGWSPPRRGSRTLRRWTDDLHRLLRTLDATRPIVLVGHSFGTFVARVYASRFPGDVAALVLIDPPVAEPLAQPSVPRRLQLWRAAFFSQLTGLCASVGIVRLGLWGLLRRGPGNPGPVLGVHPTPRRIARELAKLPPAVLPALRARWSEPRFFRELASSVLTMPACAAEALRHPLPAGLPVLVISAEHCDQAHLRAHAALATRHVIVEGSAHWVHLDRPEAVASAIIETALGSAAGRTG
jgi:pimeloyl-ACP methyl ester carboxylesterase